MVNYKNKFTFWETRALLPARCRRELRFPTLLLFYIFPSPGRCGLQPHRIWLWHYRINKLIFINLANLLVYR